MMNYNLEIQRLLLKIDQQAHIQDKITLLKQAILIADTNNDLDWGFDLRFEIIHHEGFLGKSIESLMAFAQLLNLCDSQPGQFDEVRALKTYKWMIYASFDRLTISIGQLNNILEDYSLRLSKCGYSRRSYYEVEASWSLFIGDIQRARKYLVLRDMETFDEMCSDDEMITEVCVELLGGNIEKGITIANEFLSQKPDQKNVVYSILIYYLNLAKDSRASEYFEKIELILSDLKKYPYMIFDMSQLMYYLSKNDKEKAWIYFEQYSFWEIDTNEYYSFDFSLSVLPLFLEENNISLRLSSKLPFYKEDGIYNTTDLYKYYSENVYSLGHKFDERNGNSYFCEQINKHMN